MRIKVYVWGVVVAGAVALSACAGPSAAGVADKAMDQPTAAPAAMATQPMDRPAATPQAAMDTPTAPPQAMPTMAMEAQPSPAAAAPGWFAMQLTDVTTGQPFTLGDLRGKVLLAETMAIWCTTCLRQQGEVQAMHKALGERADLVSVTLDVDPNEDAGALKDYVAKHGFSGLYAVATPDLARELSRQLGNQFLNPPSAPMFIVDRQGQVHALPFGVKNAQALADALEPYLKATSN